MIKYLILISLLIMLVSCNTIKEEKEYLLKEFPNSEIYYINSGRYLEINTLSGDINYITVNQLEIYVTGFKRITNKPCLKK